MHLGREAMLAQQQALEVTRNNIANVNTDGYCRQRAQIVEVPPARIGNLVLGRGASVEEIEVFRNKFVELRLSQQMQKSGYTQGQSVGLNQLQAIFNESSGSGVQDALTAFFGSFLQLASDPSSTPLRQDVLAKADRLASILSERSTSLRTLQLQTDEQVRASATEINRLTEQINLFNEQIVPMERGGLDAAAIRDQRQVALNSLAEQIDISYYENDNGTVVVSTSSGRALVTGGRSKPFEFGTDANGFTAILTDGTDITNEISFGELGAALHLRDTVYKEVHDQLDTLAGDLMSRVNAQHQLGYDLGNPPQSGGDLFVLSSSSGHVASRLQVAITDVSKIAAGLTTDPGDNGNAKAIYGLVETTSATLNNLSFQNYVSGLSTYVAQTTQANEADLDAQQLLLTQLQRLRESESGVSLDEEAADMIRFQRAFEASSRFFSVINDLTAELLNMVG
jgi:flagellar hook-associated protein 1